MRICPDCGETCAHPWCGKCERMLPLTKGCAFGQCDDPLCELCVGLPLRFPPVEQCEKFVQTRKPEGVRCRLIKGHTCECRPMTRAQEARQANATRDGAPKLAGERKRGNLAFEKRHRVGPHR